MYLLRTVEEVVHACNRAQRPLGLVPTMGALHEGHLSLVRRARRDNAAIAVSIFVNPVQFGPQEDFTTYPRSMAHDLSLLGREGVDLVFAPALETMYPIGFDTYVEVGHVAARLEGEHRPSHFRGVATIVAKLFAIIRPDRAYFGQKDGQQVAVIKRMARDLNTGVEIIAMPTVREHDGLALSSRNAYLNSSERKAATVLYRALCAANDCFQQGEREAQHLRGVAISVLAEEPLARTDYVSIATQDTIQEMECVDCPAMMSLAVHIGQTRLIDNLLLHP